VDYVSPVEPALFSGQGPPLFGARLSLSGEVADTPKADNPSPGRLIPYETFMLLTGAVRSSTICFEGDLQER